MQCRHQQHEQLQQQQQSVSADFQRTLHSCCRRIIGCKALCRLNTDTRKRAAGGKWALVLEYAKVSTTWYSVPLP
jgi:aromatic ring hydroxylase